MMREKNKETREEKDKEKQVSEFSLGFLPPEYQTLRNLPNKRVNGQGRN